MQDVENIRNFVWLIMKNSLPTNLTRFNRHDLDASCQRCGASQESVVHTLRDCPKSSRIWEIMQLDQHFDYGVTHAPDWIYGDVVADYGVLFILICFGEPEMLKFLMIVANPLGLSYIALNLSVLSPLRFIWLCDEWMCPSRGCLNSFSW